MYDLWLKHMYCHISTLQSYSRMFPAVSAVFSSALGPVNRRSLSLQLLSSFPQHHTEPAPGSNLSRLLQGCTTDLISHSWSPGGLTSNCKLFFCGLNPLCSWSCVNSAAGKHLSNRQNTFTEQQPCLHLPYDYFLHTSLTVWLIQVK